MNLVGMNSDFTTVVNDDDLLSSEFGESRKIFTDNEGKETVFQVNEKEADRMNIIRLIERNGGKVGQDSNILISSEYSSVKDSYKPSYIYNSVREGLPLLLQNYKNVQTRAAPTPGNHSAIESAVAPNFLPERYISMNKNGFTEEEDNFIIEEVRKNPSRRNTHKLYHEISAKLQRHTGNSVRYRFRNLLQLKLDYVYKTDYDGNLVISENGELIPVKDLPKTLKNKFTAHDDFSLCKEILNNIPYKHGDILPQKISVPSSLFQLLEGKYPNHTKSAWRDRYRKFASNFGIDKYITYYENQIAQGEEPEPMRNFTSRATQSRKKVLLLKNARDREEIEQNRHTSSQRPLDDEIGENQPQRVNINPSDVSRIISTQTPDSVNIFISGDPESFTQLNSEKFFSESFFEIPKEELEDKIKEVVERNYSGDHSAEELIDELYNEIGILKDFGNDIVYAVCGDVALVYTYIDQCIKTGQHPPLNCSGIWGKEYDKMLYSGDPDDYRKLISIHGQSRIDMRKGFLEILEENGA